MILVVVGLSIIVAGIGTLAVFAFLNRTDPTFRVVAPCAAAAVVGGLIFGLGLSDLKHDRREVRAREAQQCVDAGGVPWLHGHSVDCLRKETAR